MRLVEGSDDPRAGVDCAHHRRRAHGMDLNIDAGLLPFIDDRPEDFNLLRGRSGDRSQENLARKLDAHLGHRTNLGARHFGSVVGERDPC